jgi:hypothetical protein
MRVAMAAAVIDRLFAGLSKHGLPLLLRRVQLATMVRLHASAMIIVLCRLASGAHYSRGEQTAFSAVPVARHASMAAAYGARYHLRLNICVEIRV